MPELPEVEVVRRGLERGVVGRTRRRRGGAPPAGGPPARGRRRGLPGAARGPHRHAAPSGAASTCGCRSTAATPLIGHLGMSGQLLVKPAEQPDETHLRVRLAFTDGGRELRFVDQRTFGGLAVVAGGRPTAARTRSRTSPATRSTPPSTTRRSWPGCGPSGPASSGRCWTRRWSAASATSTPTRRSGGPSCTAPGPPSWSPARRRGRCSRHVRDVLEESLQQGGTSFDALYVSTEGVSGLFERSLERLRARGPALPALRDAGPAGELHEPQLVQLPAVPAAARGRAAWYAGPARRAPRGPRAGPLPSAWRGVHGSVRDPLRAAAGAGEQPLTVAPAPGWGPSRTGCGRGRRAGARGQARRGGRAQRSGSAVGVGRSRRPAVALPCRARRRRSARRRASRRSDRGAARRAAASRRAGRRRSDRGCGRPAAGGPRPGRRGGSR